MPLRSFAQAGVASIIGLGLVAASPPPSRTKNTAAYRPTPPDQCRPKTVGDPRALLTTAVSLMGLDSLAGRVLTSNVTELGSNRYQSDRMYPPIMYQSAQTRTLSDWQTGITGRLPQALPPGVSLPPGASQRPTKLRVTGNDRAMDPWTVLYDWVHGGPVKANQECYYRDFWRTVVTRSGEKGAEERLFIDTKSGFPVKLDRTEPHPLFGDVRSEYLWTVWMKVGPAAAPYSVIRSEDGEAEHQWTHSTYALVSRDSVADLIASPPSVAPTPDAWEAPDTIRVTSSTFLLKTPIYTSIVSLQRDTVFILDATTSEKRARADSAWIGKLFPGRHPLVLVVTDLAWPHIEGVRFWAANGVPIITHRLSKEFLTDVLTRRWTLAPDLLETKRRQVKPKIQAIDGPLSLGRGSIELRAIDGVASEGALMAYLPGERFLYAGDYIQQGNLRPPAPGLFRFTYLDEVVAAVRRNGFEPENFAAMHVNLTPWNVALAALR